MRIMGKYYGGKNPYQNDISVEMKEEQSQIAI
jgi:hypothetical protein